MVAWSKCYMGVLMGGCFQRGHFVRAKHWDSETLSLLVPCLFHLVVFEAQKTSVHSFGVLSNDANGIVPKLSTVGALGGEGKFASFALAVNLWGNPFLMPL